MEDTAIIALYFERNEQAVAETDYEQKALAQSLNRFLEALPERERDIFLGRYYFLYPTAEIARRLGMKENYVRNLLSRTRMKLKKHLEKEAFDL